MNVDEHPRANSCSVRKIGSSAFFSVFGLLLLTYEAVGLDAIDDTETSASVHNAVLHGEYVTYGANNVCVRTPGQGIDVESARLKVDGFLTIGSGEMTWFFDGKGKLTTRVTGFPTIDTTKLDAGDKLSRSTISEAAPFVGTGSYQLGSDGRFTFQYSAKIVHEDGRVTSFSNEIGQGIATPDGNRFAGGFQPSIRVIETRDEQGIVLNTESAYCTWSVLGFRLWNDIP